MVDIFQLGLEVRSDGVVVASDRLKQLSKSGEEAEKGAGGLSAVFDKLGYSLQNLQSLMMKAASALALLKLAELAKDAMLLSARYETLGVVMTVIGKNAGKTQSEMAGFQQALQKTGISAIEARQGLALMGQAQIDFANSGKLARIAQDAAVVGNINSSEAFNRMITGLATGQSIMLHHLGLMTNFESAYVKAAAAAGKTTKDLTETEKSTIRMNEVIRAGVGIAGSYEAAMGTAGKQLNSMKRYWSDLMVQVGSSMQGPLLEGVTGITAALKFLSSHFEEVKLAAMAALSVLSGIAVFMASSFAPVVITGASIALSAGSLHTTAIATIGTGAYTAMVPVAASTVCSGEVTLRGSGQVDVTLKFYTAGLGVTAVKSQTVTLSGSLQTIKIENVNSGASAATCRIIVRSTAASATEWYGSQFKVYAGNRTLRYCSGTGFITSPADTPPNTAYVPRIVQPALVKREIPIPGSGSSSTRLSYGELTLANADGVLDYLTAYDFSGRPLTIRAGEQGGAFPSGYPVQLVAVVDGVTVSLREMAVKLKSPRANWEQPVATATYAGTGGVEGDTSLTDTIKPVVLGACGPMTPILVNSTTGKNIYQYNVPSVVYSPVVSNSDTKAVSVAEGGNALTASTEFYANSAAMLAEATNPAWSGDYKICPTEGMFLLKSGHTGKISCKLSPGRDVELCIRDVVRNIAGSDVDHSMSYETAGFQTRRTSLTGYAGTVITQGKTIAQLMDDIVNPIACWWGFRVDGSVVVGSYYDDADAGASASISYSDIVSFSREQAPLIWRVTVRCNHNFAVHSATDVFGTVAPAVSQSYQREWESSVFTGPLPIYKTRHPSATEMTFDSINARYSDGYDGWIYSLQNPYDMTGRGREILRITARLDSTEIAALDIGAVCTVTMPRLGLSAGRNYLVTGIQTDAVRGTADLTLWG